MSERENVQTKCDQVICESNKIIEDSAYNEIIHKIAQHIHDRAKKIEKICKVEKYRMFFDGTVGVGKTTAISTILGLIDIAATKKRDFTLLKTSSGRTTPCETTIVQNTEGVNEIVVEKLPEDEFTNLLKEYCANYFDKEVAIPEEASRIFDNMLGLKAERTDLKLKSIKDLLEIEEIDMDRLVEYATGKINYQKRSALIHPIDETDKQKSFRDKLSKIYNGELEDCPYPKSITINLSKDSFPLNLPEYIESITDTRGIDSTERKDINDTIESLDTITIMCDGVGSFGGNENILSILKSSLIKENKDEAYRVFYIGLEREAELENVERAEGEEEGKEIKKMEAENKFNQNHVNIIPSNIFFYNSFKDKNYKKQRDDFWDTIHKSLKEMYLSFNQELSGSLESLNALKENIITAKVSDNFSRIEAYIDGERKADAKKNDFLKVLGKDLTYKHPSKVRAMVNRLGKYESCDIYEIAFKIGGDEFADEISGIKQGLIAIIKELFDKNDAIEVICRETIISHIDKVYAQGFKANQVHYYRELRGAICKQEAWEVQKGYWGDGNGDYRKRVIEKTIEEIKKSEFKSLSTITSSFFDKMSEFIHIK